MKKLLVILLVLTACTSTAPRSTIPLDLWLVGDSITLGYAHYYPEGVNLGVSGAGFATTHLGHTIGDNTASNIARYGIPQRIILMGSTNDANFNQTIPDVEAAIASLTAQLQAYGIQVTHVTEPAWSNVVFVGEINTWLLQTYPNTVDCATPLADSHWSTDGLHPTEPQGMTALADCIRNS